LEEDGGERKRGLKGGPSQGKVEKGEREDGNGILEGGRRELKKKKG